MFVLIGFILTTWYCSLIGSFVTTTLYEKPFENFEDIRKYGLKILTDDFDNILSRFPEIWKNRDVFKNVSRMEFFEHGNAFDTNYGYLEYGDRWEYFYKARMKYENREVFKKTNIIVNYFPIAVHVKANSIFKGHINQYLGIIRDVGLYQHWTKGVFLDALPYKRREVLKFCKYYQNDLYIRNYSFMDKQISEDNSKVQALNVQFVMYAFVELGVGLLFSTIVSLTEFGFLKYFIWLLKRMWKN